MTRRRAKRSRSAPLPTLDALAEADGADLSDLLREVSEFRLALDTDLTIAAAAADAVAENAAPFELSRELTMQAVEAGRSALDELVTRRGLDAAATHAGRPGARGRRDGGGRRSGGSGPTGRRPAGRRLRGVPLIGVGPLVGVAIVLGLGTGFFASHLGSPSHSQGLSNAADSSLHSLSSALGQGDDQAAREAGNNLNAAIGSLIAAAPGNPAAAQAAATALTAEQSLLALTSGTLGEQLRASMVAQVAALQNTVHTPIATLVTPPKHAGAPSLTVPVPLPSKLPPSLTPLPGIASLLPRVLASHHLAPTHVPDPASSLLAQVLPSATPSPVVGAAGTPSPSASATATTTPATQSSTSAGSPSPSPTSSAPANPLPLGSAGTGGAAIFPH